MKISLITVTYNAERFLTDCLTSVSTQVGVDLEHIVIDGLSLDNTVKIIHQHRDVIQKFISESDRGMYDAMNKGIQMATGDIIGILNADDIFSYDNVLADIKNEFLNTGADVVYGDLNYIDSNDSTKVLRRWKSRPYHSGLIPCGWMPAHPTFYAKKELFEKFGAYRLDMGSAADYELMIRFLYKCKVKSVYLPKVLVKMRIGGVSNNSIKNRIKANYADWLAMKINGVKFPLLAVLLKPIRKIPQFLHL
jgi:glycosyltransferase